MEKEPKKMKPIWYFVGWMLLVIGGIIMLTGIYYFISPAKTQTVLYELHPNIWWGGIMVLVGLLFFLVSRKTTVG